MHAIANQFGPVARELLAAWSLLPRRGGVPDRRDFNPMAVARILPVVSLLQRVGEAEWRFRLVGSEIERRWGRRLTGLNYIETVAPEVAPTMARELGEVVRQPCGSRSRRRIEFDSGRLGTVETLRLPLRANDGSVSLIISCSGELRAGNSRDTDHQHAIVTILEHQFFDLGAGLAATSVLADAGPHRREAEVAIGAT